MAQTDIERLYDEHAQAVFAYLLNFTRQEADTRDLLQELFIKLAERPELLEGLRDDRAFLLRLAHNLAISLFRRRGKWEKNCEQLAGDTLAVFAPTAAPTRVPSGKRLAPRWGKSQRTSARWFT